MSTHGSGQRPGRPQAATEGRTERQTGRGSAADRRDVSRIEAATLDRIRGENGLLLLKGSRGNTLVSPASYRDAGDAKRGRSPLLAFLQDHRPRRQKT